MHNYTVFAALKFEALDLSEEKKPIEPIFGVGERVVDDPRPLPVVKAPLKIDAYVDVRSLAFFKQEHMHLITTNKKTILMC